MLEIDVKGSKMFGLFGKPAPKITITDVNDGLKSGDLILVDIRDGMEVKRSGKAKGALHVPLATLQTRCNPSSSECLDAFKGGKTIVLYCASGARSAGAARMLQGMGHNDVRNFGGLGTWVNAGGKVVSG